MPWLLISSITVNWDAPYLALILINRHRYAFIIPSYKFPKNPFLVRLTLMKYLEILRFSEEIRDNFA